MHLNKHHHNFGFTIVELLIVIVVIGILAALVLNAFSGVQKTAVEAGLKSDLSNANKQLKLYQVVNGVFPTINDCSSGVSPLPPKICLKSSPGNSYSVYTVDNSSDPQTFSLQAVHGTVAYVVTSSTAPAPIAVSLLTLTSPTATNISPYTGVTLGATITSDGGSAITAEGTCWDTTPNPITNCTATGGTTTGVFTQAVTGPRGAFYYYRGYATNAAGTAYSPDGTFTVGACFLAGTMISTPSGDVAIEKLRIGDRVWSWTNKGPISNVIRRTFVHQTASYYKLTTMFGSLLVTGMHPLLTPIGYYKTIDRIQFGDELVTMSGNKTVMSKTYIGKAETVYNIEVDEPHNYFANGFVAHNKPI